MRAFPPAVLSLAVLAAAASAQFDAFDWTLVQHGNFDATVTADIMGFSTPLPAQAGSNAAFTTTSPVAGRVSVHAEFSIEEFACNSSVAFKVVGGVAQSFSSCFFFGDLVFDVQESEAFGFGMVCNNPAWWAALSLSRFAFTPYWVALGGGLAGSAGTPAISAHGVLQPGEAVSVELASAAPGAAVTLVVGTGMVNLPFKGGVLVPSPDLLLAGLATDAGGALLLAGTWPTGVPAGAPFVLQAWIVDPAGPQGLSASNALQGSTL